MGMLMHHTWLEQQKQKKVTEKKLVTAPVEEPEREPVEEPVKESAKRGGRRKTK